MTLDTAMLTAHLVLCAAIFWSCFCRQARSTRHTTRPQIRAAFWLLSVASMALGIAPWAPALWDWAPVYSVAWPVLLMLLAVAVVQMTTAHYWRRGVPASFSMPADSGSNPPENLQSFTRDSHGFTQMTRSRGSRAGSNPPSSTINDNERQ